MSRCASSPLRSGWGSDLLSRSDRRPVRPDAGAVVAEAAVVLPLLVLVSLVLAGLVGALSVQHACADAARQAVRVLARGEDRATAEQLVREIGPRGAVLQVGSGTDLVRATVSADVVIGLGPLHLRFPLADSAAAAVEGVR